MMSVLDEINKDLTGLKRAMELQTRAATVGFDWPGVQPVFDKVREELAELAEHTGVEASSDARKEELGDLLFACVNLARHLGVEPEAAIERASDKFERRFSRVETLAREQGQPMASMSLQVLDHYWEQAKGEEL